MGYKVDSLQLELTVTAKQTASSLNRVANALVKIKKETKDMSALVNLRKELNKFSKVNLTPVADALKTIASSSVKAREKLSNMLAEVDKKATLDIDFSPAGNAEFLESFTDNYDELTSKINENTDSVMEEVKATKDLNKEKEEQSEIEKKIANEVKKTTKEIDKSGIIGKKAMNTLKASFDGAFKGLKRFAKYAGYRAIRTAFNAITTSFSEGLESAYLWSAEAENGFSRIADTMNEIQTSATQVKRQLGSLAGEVLSTLQPAITWILNGIYEVSDALSRMFAAIGGRDTYMRAKRIDTAWKDTTKDTDKATKAAKKYKEQLLGIDELNVLSTDKSGTSEAIEALESVYEEVPLGEGWSVDLGMKIHDILFDWSDLDGKKVGEKICAGIGALAGAVIGFSIAGVKGALVGAAGGFVLGVKIGTVLFDESKAKYAPRTYKQDITNTGIGAVVGGIIGAIVAGPVGAAVGLTVGASVTMLIDELIITDEEEKMQHYLDSDLKKWVDEFQTKVDKYLEVTDDIVLKIESIDPVLSSEDVANLEIAQKLVDEIFGLDEIEVKTPEELNELKTKIETLNGLGLDGIHLEFNELTQKVEGSREAVENLIKEQLKQAKVQAGIEKITELYRAQWEVTTQIAEGESLLKEAQAKRKETEDKLRKAEEKRQILEDGLVALEEESNRLLSEPWNLDREYALKDAMDNIEDALHDTNLEISDYQKGLADIDEKTAPVEAAVSKLNDAYDQSEEKISTLIGLIGEETKSMKKDTKATENLDEATSELDKALDSVAEIAPDLKDKIKELKESQTQAQKSTSKLREAMEKIKGAFNDTKTAIANSISELGKFDEKLGTKRSIEVEYAVGANMNDAAMIAMMKGMGVEVKAGGGFAQGGHLFFANENGNPEYIGNMGGRTAVANSDQMSAAIEEASFRGMARALSQYGNKNNNSDWQPMSAQDMYLLLKRTSTNESRRTGNVSLA